MTPATGNRRKFHKGPPPFPGWWWSSFEGNNCSWRWWSGLEWSTSCFEDDTPKDIAHYASTRAGFSSRDLLWSDYWPANARVPRINPNKESA